LKARLASPCSIQVSNLAKFAIMEDETVSPPSVKIYFEGALAWYLIETPEPQYRKVFDEMSLKARIWLWIQHKRSKILVNNKLGSRTLPSWKILESDLPHHFRSNRCKNPLDAYHPYFIERVIQGSFSGETLAVGPDGLDPKWLDCRFAVDLENRYPVCTID
jgi:hypothetical protein